MVEIKHWDGRVLHRSDKASVHEALVEAVASGANLTGANLTGVNLYRANLTGASGIRWGKIGPVGQGRREVMAWAHESLSEPVLAGGCFRGTFTEFRALVSDLDSPPWGWARGTEAEQVVWRSECLAAADLLELAVQS